MSFIHFDNASIEIPIFNSSNRSLRNNVLSKATGGQIEVRGSGVLSVRALDCATLRLERGTRLGLVGHNGAGKSTMLRAMAGIYEPTSGTITVSGDIAPLFDIGLGMDPDGTGWENIVLRGLYLGFSLSEIRARMDEIGQVTELGEFLDMPLRTYSTGMVTRLGFAVSTAVEPEILLIDEGIGAGDAAFIERATQRLNNFIARAGVLVVASHSEALLREWCTTGLWLEHGRPVMHGELGEVLEAYRSSQRHSA